MCPDAARCRSGPRRLLGAVRRHVQPAGPRVSGGGSALGGEESAPTGPFRSAPAGSPGSIPEAKGKEDPSASCLPSRSRRRRAVERLWTSAASHPLSLPGPRHRPGRSRVPAPSPRHGRVPGGGGEPRAAGVGPAQRNAPAAPSQPPREARPLFSRCSP